MENFLELLIKAVVYIAVLFSVPVLVAKTFLRNHVGKAALSVLMAVLLGLAVISLTCTLTNLLVEPLHENNDSVQTRLRTNPLNLDIQSR